MTFYWCCQTNPNMSQRAAMQCCERHAVGGEALIFPSPFPGNLLAEVKPELSKEWHPIKKKPLTPYNFTQSAKPKVWWQCDEGHEWQRDGYSMKSLKSEEKCPHCRKENQSNQTAQQNLIFISKI